MTKQIIAGIGNIYVETNYLGLQTAGLDILEAGKEYRGTSWEVRLGGSVVNFITQLKKFDAQVALIGKCGKDRAGQELIELLKSQKIGSDLIAVSDQVQTSVDTGVILDHSGENIQLVAGNANQKLNIHDFDLTNPLFKQVKAIYLGGFLKQESLYRDYPVLLKQLSEMGIRIFLDHGRIPVDVVEDKFTALLKSMPYVEGYFPNEEEIMGLTKATNLDQALDIALKMGPKIIVVKRGS